MAENKSAAGPDVSDMSIDTEGQTTQDANHQRSETDEGAKQSGDLDGAPLSL